MKQITGAGSMNKHEFVRLRILQVLLFLLALEGFISTIAGFNIQSMDRRAVVFGYSISRILAGLGFLGLALLFAGVGVRSLFRPGFLHRLLARMDQAIDTHDDGLVSMFLVLLYLVIAAGFLFYSIQFATIHIYDLQVAVQHFYFASSWIVSIPAQVFIFLVLISILDHRFALPKRRALSQFALFIIFVAASIHWMTLIFQLHWVYAIPGWYWKYKSPKVPSISWIFILLAGILIFLGARYILHKPERHIKNLLICIGLAYSIQVLFGFALGSGFESIRLKYARAQLSDETQTVCKDGVNLIDTIREYDSIFGDTFWYGTKPPGLAAFYTIYRDVMAGLDPVSATNSQTCFYVITRVSAFILPLVAALLLIPLYAIERLLGNDQGSHVSGVLYLVIPSVVLMLLVPDQFLFPLLFMLSVYALGVSILKKSFGFGVLAGILTYFSTFVSFSLLPLYGLAIAWLLIDFIVRGKPRSLRASGLLLIGMCVGVAALWLAFRLFLNYDPITRYLIAFIHHRHIKSYTPTLINLSNYAILNNVEFAFWSGLPLILLMVFGWARSLASAFRGKSNRMDVFAIAFLLVYLVLNMIGQTRGEVGRLWIFLLPVGSIVASKEAARLIKDPSKSVLLVVILQFITVCLAFVFLDYR